ncbi:MAG: hypothetical protein ACOYD6_06890 [Limnochordia bacterium]|jgi:hypothetical protein
MINVAKEDVLRGLKKFKRLAKQDLLASDMTSNPQFWREQAEARRNLYDRLMELVNTQGVEMAYRITSKEYAALPLDCLSTDTPDPDISGRQQAYELFFTILGVPKDCAPKELSYQHANPSQQNSDGIAIDASL